MTNPNRSSKVIHIQLVEGGLKGKGKKVAADDSGIKPESAFADEIVITHGAQVRPVEDFYDTPEAAEAKVKAINEILVSIGKPKLPL